MGSLFLGFIVGFSFLVSQLAYAEDFQKCYPAAQSFYSGGAKCAERKTKTSRRSCFSRLGQIQPAFFWQNCSTIISAARAEFEDEELFLHPEQGSALAELDGPRLTRLSSCDNWITQAQVDGSRCLQITRGDDRQSCFSRVESWIPSTNRACQDKLTAIVDSLKSADSSVQ